MNGDDEFDDFLRRRRPLFERPRDDDLEPPAEIDRLVLRQAREAIESRPQPRVFRAPGWGMPVALAATLVLAFTVILHTAKQPTVAQRAEVGVQNVARDVASTPPAAAGTAAPAAATAPVLVESAPAEMRASSQPHNSIVVDLADPLVTAEEPRLAREQSAPAADASAGNDASLVSDAEATRYAVPPPPPALAAKAALSWRRDAKTWMAEIERLRASGDSLGADAELAEFKRQHRAYAGAPDR